MAAKLSKGGVLFIVDRVMHYHAPTMRALEAGLRKEKIRFSLASALDKAGATGRVALRDKVVDDHFHFQLSERPIGRFMLRYQHGILDICKRVNPAVIVSTCHSGTATEWGVLRWARSKGARSVAWQCGYEYNPTPIKAAFLKRFVPKFDFHLCYHSNAKKYAEYYGATASKTLIMHNTVDEGKIVAGDKSIAHAKLAQMWPQLSGKKIVLYVGAVLAEKRLESVFDALSALADESIVFVLVGDGPHLPELRRRYAARQDWISTGSVVDGVGVYFDAADVFVLPGTGGLAINEAMAHATAVISGYADGSADDLVIDGVTGFRLKTDSAEELAQRIREVTSDPLRARQMGAEGEKLIRGRLSFRSFIDRVVGVLVEQHAKACASS